MNRMCTVCITLMCLLVANGAYTDDVLQFRGMNRDGKYADTGLLKAWPEGGPALVWTATGIGAGYSTATVVGDTIYVTGMVEEEEGMLYALNLDGTHKWKLGYGKESTNKQAPGTRGTLTVEGDYGYLISGIGGVVCFNLKEQSIVWQVDMMERFDGKMVIWQISESPLIVGDKLICTPGGPDASLVALNKLTGETIWTTKGFSDPSGYCSPNLINHNGHPIIITMTALYVVGVNAEDGTVLWKREQKTAYGIHASTPAYADGMVFFTAGDGTGGGVLQLSEDGASITEVWYNTDLDVYHGGFVLHDGYLYGSSSKTSKFFTCLELKTGKLMWQAEEITDGVTVFADGMLYTYEGPKAGVVNLIKASPDGFERTGTFSLTEGIDKHWAHPVIANGKMYIRNGEQLFAYAVAE